MTLLQIAQIGEPVLRTPTRPVTQEELAAPETQTFIDDLIETMRHAAGAGLAANQVYQPLQICAIEVRAPNPRYPYKPAIPLTLLVNPVIEPIGDDTFENYEGCLSVPDLRGVVRRYKQIRVRYWDRDGKDCEVTLAGISAGTFQHECDHLQGKLFVDRVSDTRTLCTWKNFERHHKDDFARAAAKIVAECGG